MKDNLIIQDKNYISAKQASVVFGYTSDYVGQLCRLGKLECKMIGRSWFVSEESVIKHRKAVSLDLNHKTSSQIKLTQENTSSPVTESVFSIDTQITFTVSLLLLDSPKIVVSDIEVTPAISFISPIFVETLVGSSVESIYNVGSSATRSTDIDTSVDVESEIDVEVADTLVLNNKNSLKRLVLASAFFVFAFLFIFRSFVFIPNISESNTVASVVSVSKDIVSGIINSFSMIPHFASNVFDHGSIYDKQDLVKVDKPPPEDSTSESFGGLVVAPSTQLTDKSELIKKKIRDSFSDEVEIKPDESGTAGIITPVFRKVKGNDFVYVMVPVKN